MVIFHSYVSLPEGNINKAKPQKIPPGQQFLGSWHGGAAHAKAVNEPGSGRTNDFFQQKQYPLVN